MTVLRTQQELTRARWAEKFTNVASGKQYLTDPLTGKVDVNSPFPLHGYFQNRMLGRDVKMLEVNAGYALVEQMTADTITDMKIQVNEKPAEQEVWDWLNEIDYLTKIEEACRNFYGNGFAVQQPIRGLNGDKNYFTVTNVDPATWYPTIPALVYEDVKEARILSVFDEGQKGIHDWYGFLETHTVGKVAYQLFKLEKPDALEGTNVALTKIPRFAGLPDAVDTQLDYLALFQVNRQQNSRYLMGQSVLFPIWDILQEVSQIQTHIRQEIIKHGRAKMAASTQSLQRAEHVNAPEMIGEFQKLLPNSKVLALEAQGKNFNMNQDIFPVPAGGVAPHYILRDLQFIEKGSAEIDKLLSRAASIVGCARSIFNLDEKTSLHVDTDKRKDRRYVRQVTQGQKQMSKLVQKVLETWWVWSGNKDVPTFNVTFSSPFETSIEERVGLFREMNPGAVFVSEEEAVRQIWTDKKPDEIEALMKQIADEKIVEPPPGSALNKIPAVQL